MVMPIEVIIISIVSFGILFCMKTLPVILELRKLRKCMK